MSSMRAVLFHGYRRTLVTYNVRMCDKREVCIMKKKTDWVSISNWAGQKKSECAAICALKRPIRLSLVLHNAAWIPMTLDGNLKV